MTKRINKSKIDIITIGDATLDTFIQLDEASVNCSIDKNSCQLCMNYADKIPIHKLEKKVAGNAANVAVGASRLGLKSSFWTVLGDDEFANRVIKKMKEENVSTKYVQKEKNSESNFTVVLNYQSERTQLVYKEDRDYKLPKLVKADFVYLSALGANHHKVYKDLLIYLLENKVRLAYNPGKIQLKCDKKICTELYKFTDILFINNEEAKLALDVNKQQYLQKNDGIQNIKSKLKALYDFGPKLVVLTDGVNGSYVFTGSEYFYLSILNGQVVERTGAGDSYAAGFLGAYIKGKSIQDCMIWGTMNAWSVVQFVGPIDGLLTLSKINKMIKNSKLIVKEI